MNQFRKEYLNSIENKENRKKIEALLDDTINKVSNARLTLKEVRQFYNLLSNEFDYQIKQAVNSTCFQALPDKIEAKSCNDL